MSENLDLLFTNWADKPKEQPLMVVKETNQLESAPKESDENSELRLLLKNLVDPKSKHLVAKKKWNKSDVLLAKRKIKAGDKGVAAKVAFSKNYNDKFSDKAVSEALFEMKGLDHMYGWLMKLGAEKGDTHISRQEIYKRMERIIEDIIKPSKGHILSRNKFDKEDNCGINFKVEIMGKKYVIKSYVIKQSNLFFASLWDDKEFSLLLMLVEGYLRETYYLTGVGKKKLNSFLGSVNGSKSGKNTR